jgi:hypothetical protein
LSPGAGVLSGMDGAVWKSDTKIINSSRETPGLN